jgi:hypothetical protein
VGIPAASFSRQFLHTTPGIAVVGVYQNRFDFSSTGESTGR